jgi:hypothetical protein
MELPHQLEEHGAGDHLARMAHETLQQPELARLQLDALTASPRYPPQQIELEIGDAQCRRRLGETWAARQRVHACQQLREGERLDQVVVAAGIETGDSVIDARQCVLVLASISP